jgi:hypothetical protein
MALNSTAQYPTTVSPADGQVNHFDTLGLNSELNRLINPAHLADNGREPKLALEPLGRK